MSTKLNVHTVSPFLYWNKNGKFSYYHNLTSYFFLYIHLAVVTGSLKNNSKLSNIHLFLNIFCTSDKKTALVKNHFSSCIMLLCQRKLPLCFFLIEHATHFWFLYTGQERDHCLCVLLQNDIFELSQDKMHNLLIIIQVERRHNAF